MDFPFFMLCLAIGTLTAGLACLFIAYRLWPLIWVVLAVFALAVVGNVVYWMLIDPLRTPWWA